MEITRKELECISNDIKQILEYMDNKGMETLETSCNTYRMACNYIATYNGFIPLTEYVDRINDFDDIYYDEEW